jgi:hypothetical protein
MKKIKNKAVFKTQLKIKYAWRLLSMIAKIQEDDTFKF